MVSGTQVWSRARTKALFDEEQGFIAPGLQTIALLSELAIERGRGATLIDLLTPGNLDRVQFFSGGAEAVEAAIKLARSYTKRTDIIGFTGAFHGKTAGVLPISDVAWKEAVGPLPPGYHLAPFPDPTRFRGTPAECLAESVATLRKVIDEQARGAPAAIVVEPVQGTAGNVVPP